MPRGKKTELPMTKARLVEATNSIAKAQNESRKPGIKVSKKITTELPKLSAVLKEKKKKEDLRKLKVQETALAKLDARSQELKNSALQLRKELGLPTNDSTPEITNTSGKLGDIIVKENTGYLRIEETRESKFKKDINLGVSIAINSVIDSIDRLINEEKSGAALSAELGITVGTLETTTVSRLVILKGRLNGLNSRVDEVIKSKIASTDK